MDVKGTPVQLCKPVEPVDVPVHVADSSTQMFLRQNVLRIEDEEKMIVEVDAGAGLGGDFVQLTYRHSDGEERKGVLWLRHVVRDWIATIDEHANPALLKALTREEKP